MFALKPETILLFFASIFLSSNSFFSYLFCSIFCSLSSYFSTHKRFFLLYLQLLSMHDCCIRVIHNMVTALLEYLDLLAVFPEAHVDLILFVIIVVGYVHLYSSHWDTHFSNFSPIFLEVCSLLLASYFSKKFAGKIGAALFALSCVCVRVCESLIDLWIQITNKLCTVDHLYVLIKFWYRTCPL